MALTKPILNTPPAFDATKVYTFTFVAQGGDQVVGNTLTIINQETGALVYSNTVTSFVLEHTVPAGILANGTYYSAYIATKNAAGDTSPQSDAVQFYCYTTPSFYLENIPTGNVVKNSQFAFSTLYNQAEQEPLQSYVYNLYDAQQVLISTSGTRYVGDTQTLPLHLTYTFSGLQNNTVYYIQVIGSTKYNTQLQTTLTRFVVQYSTPSVFTALQLSNNCIEGYISIRSNLIVIKGESRPGDPVYVDGNTAVDVRGDGSSVGWYDGFAIPDDFTVSAWGRDFATDGSSIISLASKTSETFVVWLARNKAGQVYAVGQLAVGGFAYYIYSDAIDAPASTDKVQIWLRRVGNLYDVQVHKIEEDEEGS